jgi:hypothetical protein
MISFFLDSGAFSAFTKNVNIHIDEYIKFIKQNEKHIDIYANLDVIGDAKKTYKNQKYIESKGLRPLPIYHLTTDYKWLEKYIEEGYDYIAIGGLAARLLTGQSLINELDFLFEKFICNKEGNAIIKTHGFGLTKIDLVFRYPWHSVDSTTWLNGGKFGYIFVPAYKNNNYDYTQKGKQVFISNNSPYEKKEGMHFINLSKNEQNYIIKYIKSQDMTIEQILNDYRYRNLINIYYFQNIQNNYKNKKFTKQQKGFF